MSDRHARQLLDGITPFSGLPDASRHELVAAARCLSLRGGEQAITDDSSVGRALYVVLSGRVRLIEPDQHMTVRQLRAGECFGHFMLFRKLSAPYRAESAESSELLQIPGDALERVFARHPVFAAWFRADVRRFERELGAFDDVAGARFLFGQRLREVDHSRPPLSRPVSLTIREAAAAMARHSSDHLVVVDGERPVGLLTKSDLCDRVLAAGLDPERPVSDVMTGDLLTIPARQSVFEGMMAMERRGWRHLLLLDDDGVLQGVISDTDLARTLIASPVALRQRVAQAGSGDELRRLRQRADQAFVTLYRRAVRGEDILRINTRFNDAMTLQAISLARQALPEPPAGLQWCWLSLGSEGRGEMGLRTDQDNAIVYACDDEKAADDWLRRLARGVNDCLASAGIALCDGGIMAREAAMRHTLSGWRSALGDWLKDPDDVRLLWVAALADCRPVCGEASLCDALKRTLLGTISSRPAFLRVLAREALAAPLPVRRFPSRRLRGSGSGVAATLNVKRQGSQLITNVARLLCLEAGWLEQSHTSDRLAFLAEQRPALRSTASEALAAAELLTDLRLNWHVELLDRGEALRDQLPLAEIGDTRERLLLGAYATVEEIRLRVREQFGMGPG